MVRSQAAARERAVFYRALQGIHRDRIERMQSRTFFRLTTGQEKDGVVSMLGVFGTLKETGSGPDGSISDSAYSQSCCFTTM